MYIRAQFIDIWVIFLYKDDIFTPFAELMENRFLPDASILLKKNEK